MNKFGISCALEQLPAQQPVVIRGKIQSIAMQVGKLGYDAIELFIKNPKQYDSHELKKAADMFGLKYCAIATGMEYTINNLSLISDDSKVRRMAVDRLKEHLDLGAAIGCPVIVGIMRGNIPDMNRYSEYEDYFSEALYELSKYGCEQGSDIVVESITRYINNYLNSAPETGDYLSRLNCKNIKLHIDTHSMNVEDRDLVQSIYEIKDILGYVHFSDSNRGYPGAGNVDFGKIMNALMDIGYEGYITIECQPYPNELECAKRGLEYMKAIETCVAIKRQNNKRF